MSVSRFADALLSSAEEIDNYLSVSLSNSQSELDYVRNLPLLDRILYGIRIINLEGRLSEADKPMLHDKMLLSYLIRNPDNPAEGYLRWKKVSNIRNTYLYVNPKVVDYVLYDRLQAANIYIYVGNPERQGRNDEIFYLTEGIPSVKEAIDQYGDYCMIIAIDRELTAGYNIAKNKTPEYYTITSYNPEWLVDYLLLPAKRSSHTYMVSGFTGMIGSQLHVKLRGWRLVYNSKGYVDYLSHNDTGNGRLKSLDYLAAGMKNVIMASSVEAISDKSVLYDTLTKIDPDQRVVLPAKDLEESDTMESLGMGDVVILRPVGAGAYQGKGITVVSTNEELKAARVKMDKWEKVTVSPYIRNPLLFNGRKMHLRVLLLVTSWGVSKMYEKADGSLAKLPYKDSDYDNADIHDTHAKSTDIYFVFPDMFPTGQILDNMKAGLEEIRVLVTKAIRGHVRAYSECRYGYELLGLDVMFRDDGSAILIEVNTNAGFNVIYEEGKEREYFKWYEDLTRWVYDNAIGNFVRSLSNITIKPLGFSSDTELKQLSPTTTNPSVMKWIGVGEIWDFDTLKVKAAESLKDFNEGQYLDWIILDDAETVGYVSLRTLKRPINAYSTSDMQIRIIVRDTRKGYATKAVMLAVSEYRNTFRSDNKIVALIRADYAAPKKYAKWSNLPSINLFKKLKWRITGMTKIGNDNYEIYEL